MSKIFKPRRGTKSTFNTGSKSSTILDEGEVFFEVPDEGQGKGRCRIKMGDGNSTYATLPYAIPFTEDEIIVHNGTDTKSVSASSSIGSSTVSTYLNNAKSGNTLKTIIHNLREAIYRNACDISYLNNNIGGGGTVEFPIGSIIHSYTCSTEALVISAYGGNAWTQIKNRFLYGSTSAGTTGGSNDAIVVSHKHTFISYGATSIYTPSGSTVMNVWGSPGGTVDRSVTTEGSSGTNKNMPAYYTCYIWRRTS